MLGPVLIFGVGPFPKMGLTGAATATTIGRGIGVVYASIKLVIGLRTVSTGFPFFAFGMVLTQAFNGAGDTFTPTMINIGVFWLFEVPLALALAAKTSMGPLTLFVSVAVSYSMLAVVSAVLFRRGHWKRRRV